MKTIKLFIAKCIRFIFLSSADPAKASASLKYALVLSIPFLLAAIDAVCAIGDTYCYNFSQSGLEVAIDGIVQTVYYILLAVGSLGLAWAAYRKFIRTFTGENEALRDIE